jgi:TRAP-type C4-dicarboxylate transport system permease small subunit
MNDQDAPAPAEHAPGRRWRFLTLTLSAIAAVLLFSMMALTFADVLGRYVFIAPIPGAFEVIEFMLALLIFAGLPLVTFDNAHITVSILDGLFGPRALWIKQFVILLASAVAVGFIAERMWAQATDMVEAETITGFLEMEIAPIIYAMSLLSAVTCVVQLWMAWEHLRAGIPPRDGDHSRVRG